MIGDGVGDAGTTGGAAGASYDDPGSSSGNSLKVQMNKQVQQ
jgi:hypothetical protein